MLPGGEVTNGNQLVQVDIILGQKGVWFEKLVPEGYILFYDQSPVLSKYHWCQWLWVLKVVSSNPCHGMEELGRSQASGWSSG